MSLDLRPDATQPDVAPSDVLRRAWALLHNKRVGLGLILAMGVLTLLGVVFPQAPDAVRDDPELFAAWLDGLRPVLRGWTDPLAAVGLFGVFSSVAFTVVVGLLVASIVACTLHRLPLLWQQATRPHVHVRPAFFDHARVSAGVPVAATAEAASARVADALSARRFRVLVDEAGTGLYADRNRFAPLGTVVAHLAFVVILAGVLITSQFGLRLDNVPVTVGTTVEVGNGTGLAVEARSFTDTYHPDGSAADYVSDLVLHANGVPVADQLVRVNSPLRWGGYSVNQASFGIAAVLSATDAAGAVVHEGGVPLQYATEDGRYSYGRLELPDRGLLVYVITPASGQAVPDIAAGEAQLEVYVDGADTPALQQRLTPGGTAEVAGLTWTFVREAQYTGLMVSRDPGAIWVWVGAALLALGTCWTMFFRHHRIWVRITPDGHDTTLVQLASPDRHDSAFESSFHALAHSLAAAPADQTRR